jgi:hypothetical protein
MVEAKSDRYPSMMVDLMIEAKSNREMSASKDASIKVEGMIE